MKKIIFDLDNTLMMFDNSYIYDYCHVINGSYEDGIKLYEAIGKYEDRGVVYNKEDMLKCINEYLDTNYNMDVLNSLIDSIADNWIKYVPSNTKDVLEYLSNKYELYVLTNWFSECQAKRLDNVGILKYFKEVVGADKVKPKPNIDGYLYIIGDSNLEDVIMIGDNIDVDIKGANDVGIKSILIDYRNRYDGIARITDIKELMNVF